MAVGGIDGAAMELHGVAHDGKTKAGATHQARAPLVDTVEPLEYALKMLIRYPRAIVRHTECIRLGRRLVATHPYLAPSAVGYRIVYQIAEYRAKKRTVPLDHTTCRNIHRQ